MIITGIDPGISGALAFISDTTVRLVDMPVILTSGKKAKHEISGAQLAAILRSYGPAHAYLERVHAMPDQGVTACFNFGQSLGIIRGVLESLQIPYSFITPQAWKKNYQLLGSDKDAARGRAIQLYPQASQDLARKKDIGRADALLIGRYGHLSQSPIPTQEAEP